MTGVEAIDIEKDIPKTNCHNSITKVIPSESKQL